MKYIESLRRRLTMRYIEAPEDDERIQLLKDAGIFLAGGIANCPDWLQDTSLVSVDLSSQV